MSVSALDGGQLGYLGYALIRTRHSELFCLPWQCSMRTDPVPGRDPEGGLGQWKFIHSMR